MGEEGQTPPCLGELSSAYLPAFFAAAALALATKPGSVPDSEMRSASASVISVVAFHLLLFGEGRLWPKKTGRGVQFPIPKLFV